MSRELWQLLIDMNKEEPVFLTASECFALLEFFAQLQTESDMPEGGRSPALLKCLACVPTCRAELLAMLETLITSNSQEV
jgi:hypothetical protein